MIDNDYSKNKTLLPDFGLGVIQKASYRVVPFSKSKDTREIKRVIICLLYTSLPLGEKPYMRLLNVENVKKLVSLDPVSYTHLSVGKSRNSSVFCGIDNFCL